MAKKKKNAITLLIQRDEYAQIILAALRQPSVLAETHERAVGCNDQMTVKGLLDPPTLRAAIESYRDSFIPGDAQTKAEEAFRAFMDAAMAQQKAISHLTVRQQHQLVERLRKEYPRVKYDIFTNFPG